MRSLKFKFFAVSDAEICLLSLFIQHPKSSYYRKQLDFENSMLESAHPEKSNVCSKVLQYSSKEYEEDEEDAVRRKEVMVNEYVLSKVHSCTLYTDRFLKLFILNTPASPHP